LLAYLRILEGQTPSLSLRIAAVALAFLLATLTHHFVENPMRLGKFPKRKMLVSLVSMVFVAALGQYIFLKQGLPQRRVASQNPAFLSGAAGGAGPDAIGQCYAKPDLKPHIDGCLMDDREAPVYALIGDSKAGALAPGVFRTSTAGGRWLYMGNNDGKGKYMSTTLLSQDLYPREYPLTRQMLDTIEAHPLIHAVVIANAIRNMYHLHDETSIEELQHTTDNDKVLNAFDHTISELITTKHSVYLVVDNPTLDHPEDCVGRITSMPLINTILHLPTMPSNCEIAYSRYLEISANYRKLLQQLQHRHPQHLSIIETADIFCDKRTNACPMIRDGRLLYGYTDHPSDYAAGLIGARINAQLKQ
jgi:hypothetical protein